MSGEKQRGLTGALISAPTALALLGLFFMPWLKLSCNPKTPEEKNALAAMQENPMMSELTAGEIGHASGWDLAAGEFTAAGRYAELQRKQEELFQQDPSAKDHELPESRPWVYLALALPILLLVVSVGCVAGAVAPQGGGKLMLLLAVAGAIAVLSAATVDYVDDAFDLAEKQASSGGVPSQARFAFQRGMEQAKDNAKKVVPTEATLYLWASLGLYGVAAVCGFVTLGTPGPIPGRSSTTPAASSTFRHDPSPPGAPSGPPQSHAPPGIPSYAPPPIMVPASHAGSPPPIRVPASHAPPGIPSYALPPITAGPIGGPVPPLPSHLPMSAQPSAADELPCFGPDLLPLGAPQTRTAETPRKPDAQTR
jgi:hypothetical protein